MKAVAKNLTIFIGGIIVARAAIGEQLLVDPARPKRQFIVQTT